MKSYPNKKLDSEIIGFKFGRLLPIRLNPVRTKARGKKYDCICDCGEKVVVRGHSLRHGVESCGCLRVEKFVERNTKHLLSSHVLYKRWSGMIARCENPKNPKYKHYGARGISVCQDWRHSVESFYDWAIKNGWSEELHIDRKDNNKNYSPDNCHFITTAENNRNLSTSCRWFVNGRRFKSCTKAGLFFGVSSSTIRRWCEGYTTTSNNRMPPRGNCYKVRVYE